MKVAVIPARGGSKRIPRKNTNEFCGKPMIAWSIEAALQSACFDRIVVSTDDRATADIAKSLGAEVPFKRPAELADDFTPLVPVIAHATEQLRQEGNDLEFVCCIYATAPFLQADYLLRGHEAIQSERADFAVSVTAYPYPIQRALKLHNGKIEMFNQEHYNTRSQDLEPAYHDAAQFVWGTADAWSEGKPVFGSRTVPIILPAQLVQDIDSLEDWYRAEWLFHARQLSSSRNVA